MLATCLDGPTLLAVFILERNSPHAAAAVALEVLVAGHGRRAFKRRGCMIATPKIAARDRGDWYKTDGDIKLMCAPMAVLRMYRAGLVKLPRLRSGGALRERPGRVRGAVTLDQGCEGRQPSIDVWRVLGPEHAHALLQALQLHRNVLSRIELEIAPDAEAGPARAEAWSSPPRWTGNPSSAASASGRTAPRLARK